MNLADVVCLLESYDIKVKASGSGGVISQSIKVGKKLIKGSVIKLELA